MKTLVVYFSAEGHTARVAREFAESIGVSKSTIGNCEIGMQGISDQIWARIKEKYPHNGHHEAGIDDDHNGQDDVRDQDDGQMAVGRRACDHHTVARRTRNQPGGDHRQGRRS